jgi:cytochrome P450
MDKDYWGDPETFRPERFLDGNMTIIRDERVLGAFGYGKG